MHQLFLRTFILIFLAILFIITVVTYYWSKSIYLEQVEKNLSQNIDSISVVLNDLLHIENSVQQLKAKTNLRITIIDQNGKVLAESDKDKDSMENHSNRYEIIHAKYEGYGKIIRYSNTVKKEMLYVAKKVVINDRIYYIRMADYLNVINENFLSLTFQVIPLFALFLLIAFFASYLISKRIQTQTDNILSFLVKLTKKEEVTYIESSYIEEFDKIARLLKKVAMRLSKKDKQKAKQTAKLKLANRQKDEIISAISHEFKNPIAIVSGYCETILNDDDLPEAMKNKFLNKIYNNSIKMSNLIDRLRLALKLDEGKEEATFKPTELKRMCEDVSHDLQESYNNREIIIQGEKLKLNVDDALMSIAISNLIENALKYSEDKVIVTVEPECIKILDEGIGISQEEVSKITKKFYRVSKNGWNNSLGLGLNIVLNILNIHKFSLDINSQLGQGSEFIIKFSK